MGVVVRAVPRRVPDLPAGRHCRGKQVAFLGVNGADKLPAAQKFLAQRPLPYPSYEDPDEEIAQKLEGLEVFPMTVFLDAKGHTAFIKSGAYTSRAELEADIDKYLGKTCPSSASTR